MIRIPQLTAALLAVAAFSASSEAQQKSAPAQPTASLELEDGDTFVFLGDSITHQSLYTQYFENFFYTRYPDRKIRFRNAGVSGDKAADAIARFEDDVTAFSPKYVSILLGMNDGQYEPIDGETLDRYTTDMTSILDRIEALGAKPIVMSPTMFDHHQLSLQMENPEEYRFSHKTFDNRYNSLLAYFGGWLRERASERGAPFVDQWGPMNDITFKMRRTRPDYTLIPDAIHPGAAGHFLMAFEMLDQFSPDRRSVSGVTIMPHKNGWIAGTGKTGTVTDLKVAEGVDGATFTFLARSLPWVVPTEAFTDEEIGAKWGDQTDATVGYKFTIAGHRLSSERLRFVGIAEGEYEILIDGVPLSKTYTHSQLSMKIEIQADEATPQYQQALRVAELNRDRNDLAIRPIRNLWSGIKGMRNKHEGTEEFEKLYEAQKEKIDTLLALAEDYEAQIFEAAKPIARKYEIRRVK